MDGKTYYEDSNGLRITQDELFLGINSVDNSVTSIPLDSIDNLVVQPTRDWKPGLAFLAGGLIIFSFASGWVYFLALASAAWGAFILFHPSQRLYKLFFGLHAGTTASHWPLKSFKGQRARQMLEEIVHAFDRAKLDAIASAAE